jgi:LPS sulfotransferase NodH
MAEPSRPAAYVLCTTPRSGSTMLCGLLAATGVAGRPGSHFHEPCLTRWLEAHGLAPSAFGSRRAALEAAVAAARARGSAGGVFGLRMQRRSFPYWIARLGELHPGLRSDRARIEAAFGPTAYVHLRREDGVAQAVSRLRAEQTGLWHRSADGTELERLAPPARPRYDRAALARIVEEDARGNEAWEAWFRREGVTPRTLTYEALADDPAAALARVLRALGLDPSAASGVVPPTARLADRTSARWAARFAGEGGH